MTPPTETTPVNLTELRGQRAQFRRQAFKKVRAVLRDRLREDPDNYWIRSRIEHCEFEATFSFGYALALDVYEIGNYRAGDYMRALSATSLLLNT